MDFGGFFKPKDQNSSAAKIPCVIEALGVAMASLGTNVPSSMSTRPTRQRKSGRGAIPVLNQVMGATRGATDAFSGVGRHVNNSLRKLGAKNIEAGIGCGVGFGHGFGVGLAVKPGVVKQIQSSLVQALTMMVVKFGIAPNLSLDQGLIPASLQSSIMPSNQNPVGSIMQLATKVPDRTSQSFPAGGNLSAGSYETSASKKSSLNPSHGSRTEEVIGSFLQNPLLKDEGSELNELDGRLRSENNMLHMVLKHQQVIEDLMKENEKLRRILVEDLNIPPSKLQASFSSSTSPCADCFECRRKQRRK